MYVEQRAFKKRLVRARAHGIADYPLEDRSPPHATHSTRASSSNVMSNAPQPPPRDPWLHLSVPGVAAREHKLACGTRGVLPLCTAATQTSA